jgi:hypothetical protein
MYENLLGFLRVSSRHGCMARAREARESASTARSVRER